MPSEVKILNQEAVFQGFFRVDKFQLQIEQFQGGLSAPMEREVFRVGRAAVVLLYDPRQDKVILIEQFRMAPCTYGQNPWLFECVAGLFNDAESAEAAARRETVEESGYQLKRLELIGQFYSSPGAMDELSSIFIGEIDAGEHGEIHGLVHEHENIRVHVLAAAEAIVLLDTGKIMNGPAAIALHWFARHGANLRQKWLAK